MPASFILHQFLGNKHTLAISTAYSCMFMTHYARLKTSLTYLSTRPVQTRYQLSTYLKNDLCKELMLSHYSDSVVVITSALHAEGRGFNPRSEYVLSTFLGRRDRKIKTTCSGGVELVLARLATAFFRQPFRDTLQQTQSFVLSKYQSQKKLSRSERYQV